MHLNEFLQGDYIQVTKNTKQYFRPKFNPFVNFKSLSIISKHICLKKKNIYRLCLYHVKVFRPKIKPMPQQWPTPLEWQPAEPPGNSWKIYFSHLLLELGSNLWKTILHLVNAKIMLMVIRTGNLCICQVLHRFQSISQPFIYCLWKTGSELLHPCDKWGD